MSTPVPSQNPTPNGPPSDPAIGDQNNNGPATPPAQSAAMFTAEQLEAVRKEEKNKLYAQIQSLQAEQKKANDALAAIQAAKDAELAAAQQAQATKDAEAQAAREAEMSAKDLLEEKLRANNDTWEARFNQLQQERDTEKALLAKEREYNELVAYRNAAIDAAKDDIAPQFYDFISGENKEQIDAGIARAKAATESIAQQFQAAQQAQLSQMRGVSPTGYATTGPMDMNPGTQTLSDVDIANMSMTEFAKLRQKTGIGSAEARTNRGLFG
ncbi:hypothetical protein HWB05_gp148 [Streptomyces phage BRock]|uniref:Scaffolding protein n=1 Tax=Streptomyces phage BRock TaxID=1913591 RepID=A0A1J0GW45_9CAUD|nr:hypothetical protein HWB05_gp148 [Streptomyces phage BRock]APC46410.1 hypothetical protein [Streptomyces phage BRock]